ncbi:MAG: FHIPEP family type III secretion protein [Campylobacterota bacterium]
MKNIKLVTFIFVLVTIFAGLLIPLSKMVLDILIIAFVAVAVALLLFAIFMKPKKGAVLPEQIFWFISFKLFLCAAITKAILLHGSKGLEQVSSIIAKVGEFSLSNNLIISCTVFFAFMLINFFIMKKTRYVTELADASFILTIIPLKADKIQEQIDAQLIDQAKVNEYFDQLHSNIPLYGAFGGVSMLLIISDYLTNIAATLINIVGGIIIGMFLHGMTLSASSDTFFHLAVAAWFVIHIPVLLVSIAIMLFIKRLSIYIDKYY